MIKKFQKKVKRVFFTPVDTRKELLLYLATAIGEESGEVSGEIKKAIRDNLGKITKERKQKILSEIGDLMFYLTMLCETLNESIKKPFELQDKKLDYLVKQWKEQYKKPFTIKNVQKQLKKENN